MHQIIHSNDIDLYISDRRAEEHKSELLIPQGSIYTIQSAM